MPTRDTSQAESARIANERVADAVESVSLHSLLDRPVVSRGLADIDDPLEGCDSLVRSITFGRVGDPAGTHTREQCKAATVKLFGYQPEWVNISSSSWERPDGDEVGQEVEGV